MRAPKIYLALPFESVNSAVRRAPLTSVLGADLGRRARSVPALEHSFDVSQRARSTPGTQATSVPLTHRRISHRHR